MKIIKRFAIALLACLPAFGVGSVVASINPLGPPTAPSGFPDARTYVMVINWTGDAITGSVPSTVLNISQFPVLVGMRVNFVEIQPGSPSPSANYSVTLTDAAGIDLLQGTAASLSATVSSFSGSLVSPPLLTSPTFNLSGNSVTSAKGTVSVYFVPQPLAPTPIPGAGLSATNVYTGTNTFTGLLQCKNFEGVRCVDPTNAAGWTGTTGDAWINAAITDLATNGVTKGGEVWVSPGVYSVANTIRISTSNIKLKCLGESHSFNTGGPSCTLNWAGAAAGTMILVDTANTSAITGDGLYGFFLNCSGANAAATGISILSAQNGEYEQIDVTGGFTAQGILLSADASVTNPATGNGTAQSWFRNINVFGGAANAHGWNLTGTATNDIFMNTFHTAAATTSGTGDAWHIENADNNRWFSINGASATGFGLHLTCMASAASQNMCARENEFFNSNLGSNPIKQDGVSTFYSTSNRVYGYEICNGSALPTTSVILKGSLYIDTLDCGDNNFSTRIFATGASGTSFQADDYNYKSGHTISNAVNYTSHIFDSSTGGVTKSLQWNDNGTTEWICGFIAGAQWSCFDSVNGQNRLVLGKSGGTNANIYNVPTGLTHNFQVNNSNVLTMSNTTTAALGNLTVPPSLTTASGAGNVISQSCSTSQKTETAADANLLTCAIPAVAGTYRVRFVLSVSATNTATLGWTLTWTDANGGAIAPTNQPLWITGNATPQLTFALNGTGADLYGQTDVDVNNSGTSIVVKLTFTGTSFAAKASATVERII